MNNDDSGKEFLEGNITYGVIDDTTQCQVSQHQVIID